MDSSMPFWLRLLSDFFDFTPQIIHSSYILIPCFFRARIIDLSYSYRVTCPSPSPSASFIHDFTSSSVAKKLFPNDR